MRGLIKAIVDSYQIWNKILSYLPPDHKQMLTLMNKDLSKRTKDFIEWELREYKYKSIYPPPKPTAVAIIQPSGPRSKSSRESKKPKELIDKEFVDWASNK